MKFTGLNLLGHEAVSLGGSLTAFLKNVVSF